jgi:hypothetical protein
MVLAANPAGAGPGPATWNITEQKGVRTVTVTASALYD